MLLSFWNPFIGKLLFITLLLILRLWLRFFVHMDWRSYTLVDDDWRLVVLTWGWNIDWVWLGWLLVLLLPRRRLVLLRSLLILLLGWFRLVSRFTGSWFVGGLGWWLWFVLGFLWLRLVLRLLWCWLILGFLWLLRGSISRF